jgi:3-dehydroquinate dehydratase-1
MQIVVSATGFDDVVKVEDVADVIELRLDLFESLPHLEEIKKIKKPKIITIRKKEDGGKYTGSEEERFKLFSKYSNLADYLDIELDSNEDFFEFNCKIIESYHNFNETPEYKVLKGFLDNRRGKIFKIATLGKSRDDVLKIVRILNDYENVVAFLMGEEYAYTRLMSLFLGSPFIYCHAGDAVARGQLEAHNAKKIIQMLRGGV